MSDEVSNGRGSVPSSSDRARRAIALIDLTDLDDEHSGDGIDSLCARARQHSTAAVCVWPEFVERCVDLLRGSDVRVATVVNFPSGAEAQADVVAATERALADGADDIDVVLPYRAFSSGDRASAARLVEAVAAVVEPPRILKVILETGALEPSEVGPAARLAIDSGADFVKTSTGKLAVGATPEAAGAMLAEIAASDRSVGLEPSGGIRTLADADLDLTLAERALGPGWASADTFRFRCERPPRRTARGCRRGLRSGCGRRGRPARLVLTPAFGPARQARHRHDIS